MASSSNSYNNINFMDVNHLIIINGQFHEAVAKNNIDKVKEYLTYGAQVNCRNINGATASHVAIINRNISIFKLLIEVYRADVNAINHFGRSLVATACSNDFLIALKILIAYGAHINLPDSYGDTPLHICVLSNSLETCAYLLTATGLDVNIIDYRNGRTPLHYACLASNFEMVKLICNQTTTQRTHVNLNAIDIHGNTPLNLVCHKPENFLIAQFLIASRCNINIRNYAKHSPLDVACSNDSHQIVRLLIKQPQLIRDNSNPITNTYLQVHSALEL